MPYPQAPWLLQGHAFQTIQLFDGDRVRAGIPSELEIVSPIPGKTLGGIYFASYTQGSVLQYNELIVVSAFVRKGANIGAWISHIYVDHPDSVAGGRDIWGLPKELAQFDWQVGARTSVVVSQGSDRLCQLTCDWELPGLPQALSMSAFSQQVSRLLQFSATEHGQLHLVGAKVEIPPTSPIALLNPSPVGMAFHCTELVLTVKAPVVMSEPLELAGRR
ncbi:acetoacetate decarboxylase family protein [Leptolyngbya sp. AN02str]|uniref:acetoacetate decarboxylase family protein n=1 Tax=Leptolyngbya sp. AN02str TaxID=3423363 RepID=UPI003D313FE4